MINLNIPIEVSARHVHLSLDAVEALFGKGYKLTPKKDLSQPGQYACEERVSIIGPRGILEKVAVLGPERKKTQVEISLTDSIKIGIKIPIRESGDLFNTSGCILEGPKGKFEIHEGLIAAKRHIHMSPSDSQVIKVKNGEVVSVKILSDERSLIFSDVVVRVNSQFNLAMHIDTDEANALNAKNGLYGSIFRA